MGKNWLRECLVVVAQIEACTDKLIVGDSGAISHAFDQIFLEEQAYMTSEQTLSRWSF